MAEPGTLIPGLSAAEKSEKRKAQMGELRPLANRRPELYDEHEYSSA